MGEVIKCRNCIHLYSVGRTTIQSGNPYGRIQYYCRILKRTNGWLENFVGFGDMTKESPLKLKTSPRECPLRKNND